MRIYVCLGLMLKSDDVPWPFRVFEYIVPIRYAFEGAFFIEFHNTDFSGAHFDATDPRGWSCSGTGVDPTQCYGPSKTIYTRSETLHILMHVFTLFWLKSCSWRHRSFEFGRELEYCF